jgi:hypothetical protein
MRIGAGSSHKFKTGADGLCDAGTAGLLRLPQKVRPYLNRDFSGHFHPELSLTIVYTSIEYGVGEQASRQRRRSGWFRKSK